jgi:aryl-alcohol dehydrogenase-like predicted oxidoreductase
MINNKQSLQENMPGGLGLGCVTFGREISPAVSFQIMDKADACGIDHFDTASAYGNGASESIIGNWIASRRINRDKITIATKILPPFDRESIINSVDQSLQRLSTGSIDIIYFHRWDDSLQNEDPVNTMQELLRNGKIKSFGASNFTTSQLNGFIQQQAAGETLKYVQNNHNLAVSDIDDHFLDTCLNNGIRIITYSPLGAGFLTGKHRNGVIKGSRFDIMPAHQDIYFMDKAQQRLSNLLKVASRTGLPPAHLALSWALHQHGISKVLIGARKAEHITQAIDALAFDDQEIFAELESLN